jgi:hypothetical protein
MTYANAPRATDTGPGARTASNGMAIAALVCGIVGLFVFSIVLGPLAIIFGGIGLSRTRAGAGGRTMALWGVVLGIIDVILFIVLIAVVSSNGGGMYLHF